MGNNKAPGKLTKLEPDGGLVGYPFLGALSWEKGFVVTLLQILEQYQKQTYKNPLCLMHRQPEPPENLFLFGYPHRKSKNERALLYIECAFRKGIKP